MRRTTRPISKRFRRAFPFSFPRETAGRRAVITPHRTATHGIGVNAFASTPYNVAVGGTDFSDTYSVQMRLLGFDQHVHFGSALSYIPEIPWNDSCAGELLSDYVFGEGIPTARDGFCNDPTLGEPYLTTTAGSGGPSACATGSPCTWSGVVGGTCAGLAQAFVAVRFQQFRQPQ